MSASLNNVQTSNGYTDGTTLRCPGAVRVNAQVFNAAVVIQYARADAEALEPNWSAAHEEDLYPNGGSFDRKCDGIRVRSKVAGKPAQVTITALEQDEVGG